MPEINIIGANSTELLKGERGSSPRTFSALDSLLKSKIDIKPILSTEDHKGQALRDVEVKSVYNTCINCLNL